MMALLFPILIVLLPAYAVRFTAGSIPLNVLLVASLVMWAAFSIWLIRRRLVGEFIQSKFSNRVALAVSGVMVLAAVIGVLTVGVDSQSLGALIVLFIQPIGTFFFARFYFQKDPEARNTMLGALLLFVALCGLYAMVQYFTLNGLPEIYWGNANEPKRAIAFFGHPNFYALFAAPALALLIPFVANYFMRRQEGKQLVEWGAIALWLIGAAGLLLSLSRGGWLGLALAVGLYAVVAAPRKIRIAIFGIGVVLVGLVLANTNLRYRVLLPFKGEKSAVSRFSLWDTGWKAISEHPFTGQGLTGFSRNWDRLNTDPNIDRHNYPHNIFLNFWTETGVLGLLAFIVLAGYGIVRGIKNRKNIYALGIALFLVALIGQGMLDNPYFKNDLAMLFWLVMSLGI